MSLTTDIADLRKIGEYYLPDRARIHRDAADALAAVPNGEAKFFAACGTEGGERSSAYGAWLELYALVHKTIADTAVNLRDAGTGTVLAANAFAEQDTTNATSVDAVEAEMDRFYNGDPDADPPIDSHYKPPGVLDPNDLEIGYTGEEAPPLPTDGQSVAVA